MARDRMFFLVSLVFLGLVAAFLFRPADIPAVSNPLPESKVVEDTSLEIMVAEQDFKVGEHLNKNSYSWVKITNEEFNPSYVSKNAQTEKWLKDAVLAKKVVKGEKIKRFDIIWPQEIKAHDTGTQILSTAQGKRAVPFGLTERSGMVQFMNPGMHVDITFTSKSDIGFGTLSLTLLKNIRILAIGKDADGNLGNVNFKSNTPIEILLEMTPRQAEIFFYAQQAGKVSIGFVESDPPIQKDELADLLLKSESAGNFQSVLVTYMIRSLFPGVDINITATPKGYIVGGKVPDPQVAEKVMEILVKLAPGGDKAIVSLMEVKPQQVLVAVKVFEVEKNFRARIGVNWEALFHHSGETVGFGAVFPSSLRPDPNYFFSMDCVNIGNLTLSALVDMLQTNKLGKILADPNLTTISGQTAHFFAGGEFPILIPQGGNLIGTVTVEYKKYGVILDLTPLVDLNGLITLRIRPEVSNIDRANSVVLSGFVIPALKSRFADTTVKLWPGQSYIIAGLLEDESLEIKDSLYCLDKLPVIGPLFKSKNFEDHRTELMIIVTPYLINSDRTPENIPLICNQPKKPCPEEEPRSDDCAEIENECEERDTYTQWE